MSLKCLAICLCAIVSGCAHQSSEQPPVVWLASIEHGDKPGNGFKLTDNAGQLSATFFLLDPNKPHDFQAGRALKTDVNQISATEIRLIVHLSETQKDEMAIKFKSPLKGNRVNATLRDSQGGSSSMLTFSRQMNFTRQP